MVRTRCFHCWGLGSIPGQGTKIPQAVWHGKKERKKERKKEGREGGSRDGGKEREREGGREEGRKEERNQATTVSFIHDSELVF